MKLPQLQGIRLDRRPSTCWSLRRDLRDYVRTMPGDGIQIYVHDGNGRGQLIETDRRTARLLARRINQCLDATTVKSMRRPEFPGDRSA